VAAGEGALPMVMYECSCANRKMRAQTTIITLEREYPAGIRLQRPIQLGRNIFALAPK